MAKSLRVLLVEDSERDAALLNLYLRRAGYEATIRRVDTKLEMRAQLKSAEWDVVVSDFNLPGFNAHAALQVLHESGRRLPFLVLSGEIAEQLIAAIMQAGASDYVCKYEMGKIVPAIERAIESVKK
jgi:DNA-binding NtrC family response regulator